MLSACLHLCRCERAERGTGKLTPFLHVRRTPPPLPPFPTLPASGRRIVILLVEMIQTELW